LQDGDDAIVNRLAAAVNEAGVCLSGLGAAGDRLASGLGFRARLRVVIDEGELAGGNGEVPLKRGRRFLATWRGQRDVHRNLLTRRAGGGCELQGLSEEGELGKDEADKNSFEPQINTDRHG